ncbi:MAG: OmpA family protein [Gammaproteobacteria bacterium]
MTTLINGRTPEQYAAWNRTHLIGAVILAIVLLLLWLMGRGPGYPASPGGCCGVAEPAAVTTAPAVPATPATPAPPAEPADTDGDGVIDADDACPGTTAGAPVDAKGCEVIPEVTLYFELDKADMPHDSMMELLPVVRYLKGHPTAVAEISGYHDPTGPDEYNQELAKERAFAVRDFLLKSGVPESQLDTVKPRETTGEGPYEQARHVEIIIRP